MVVCIVWHGDGVEDSMLILGSDIATTQSNHLYCLYLGQG